MTKLSELSKPVAYMTAEGVAITHLDFESGSWGMHNAAKSDDMWCPLYSQEYVSAMLEELEAKDEALRELAFRVSAGGYNAGSVDAEVFKQKIIDGIDSISGVLIKRIDELESIRAAASQVFKEIGNELGCNPDNESIMMAIDALKERLKLVREQRDNELRANAILEKRLTTPVRLLGEMLAHDWEHSTERQATFQHRKIAWDARLAEDKKAILAAGFTFTVEGDE